MKIWTNTKTLDGFDSGLEFTESKERADILLSGSKKINLDNFHKLKAIFRAGIGKDNIPEDEAFKKNIVVRFPSQKTIDIIFEETANYTCNLILKMIYNNVGCINEWVKYQRTHLNNLKLLIIGNGNIGKRVYKKMSNFMDVITFDVLEQNLIELDQLIKISDCISIHIPNTIENKDFFNYSKLSLMKDGSILINTSRAPIVNEENLLNEISNHRIKAAFDVFWEEPYNGKLKQFHPEYFHMSPHVSSNCIDFLTGCRKELDLLIEELESD